MEHGLIALHIHTPETMHPTQIVYAIHRLSPSLRYPRYKLSQNANLAPNGDHG